MTEESHVSPSESYCPVCGHEENEVVDTHIKGRGHMTTLAIKSCCRCETLWGEEKEWYGVVQHD